MGARLANPQRWRTMPPGTGDDGEAFERFVYFQTAKQCKGESEATDGPPGDSERTLWVDSEGGRS
eukprot:8721452-Alexandrium_andersonii.AAC.1